MSKEAMETIIGKAVSDDKFREALFANPDKALQGYDLTEDEIAALKKIDAETMESMAGTLDERIAKSFIVGYTVGSVGGFSRLKKRTRPLKRIGGPLREP